MGVLGTDIYSPYYNVECYKFPHNGVEHSYRATTCESLKRSC